MLEYQLAPGCVHAALMLKVRKQLESNINIAVGVDMGVALSWELAPHIWIVDPQSKTTDVDTFPAELS